MNDLKIFKLPATEAEGKDLHSTSEKLARQALWSARYALSPEEFHKALEKGPSEKIWFDTVTIDRLNRYIYGNKAARLAAAFQMNRVPQQRVFHPNRDPKKQLNDRADAIKLACQQALNYEIHR